MATDTPVIWLVTGSNRGIGQALVESIEKRGNQSIIAASRKGPVEPKVANQSNGSKVISVRIRGEEDTDPLSAIEAVKKLGIDHIDIVVAMAGIAQYAGPASDNPAKEFRQHFEVNTVATILLFQATIPLLRKAKDPKVVYVSTGLASLAAPYPIPAAAYGASKAAGNYVITKIHQEEASITAFSISPGWVQTDMGNAGAKASGMDQAPVTKEGSVKDLLHRIDDASRENSGGKVKDFAEEDIPW